MNYEHIDRGDRVVFHYDPEGRRRAGLVRRVSPNVITIRSGDTEVEVRPADVIEKEPAGNNELPLLGERFRLSGGVGQNK